MWMAILKVLLPCIVAARCSQSLLPRDFVVYHERHNKLPLSVRNVAVFVRPKGFSLALLSKSDQSDTSDSSTDSDFANESLHREKSKEVLSKPLNQEVVDLTEIVDDLKADVAEGTSLVKFKGVMEAGTDPLLRKSIAATSILLGCGFFLFQYTQTPALALLKAMEKESPPIVEAICNGKPTVIEFYADWCENCKVIAPSMRGLQFKYRNGVNFITLNGMDPKNAPLVDRFRVDGIPHLSFLGPDAEVKTSLVGAVPRSVLDEEIEALVKGSALPFEGFDAFAEQPSHYPFGKSVDHCKLQD